MMMTVLYVKRTGHVLAAYSRAAPPEVAASAAGPAPGADEIDAAEPTPEVTAAVGSALALRGFTDAAGANLLLTRYAVPAQRLLALTVEHDAAQLLSPRLYGVPDGKNLAALPAAGGLTLTIAAADPRTIRLQLPSAVTGPAWVQLQLVSAAGASQLFSARFTPAGGAARLDFSSPTPLSGTYDTLILVQGFLPVALRVTV